MVNRGSSRRAREREGRQSQRLGRTPFVVRHSLLL